MEQVLRPPKEEVVQAIQQAEASLHEFTRQAWHLIEPGNDLVDNWHVGCILEHLQAVYEGQISNLVINIPPRHGKPVHADTPVLMKDGSRKPIKSIVVGDQVITHTGKPRKVSAVFDQGDLPCLKVTTFSGKEVIAALDHPFLTPTGWVETQHLRIGDCLALRLQAKTVRNEDYYGDAAYRLAGYFIGDGSVANGNCSITSADPDYIEEVTACCRELGFNLNIKEAKNKVFILQLSGGSREWLRFIGMNGQNSYTKKVPDFVFQGSNKQVASFIAAYFHCDGTVNKKSKQRKNFVVEFTSVSRELLNGVQSLLLRFGINARIRKRINNNSKYAPAGYVSYNLSINREDEAAKFLERIPILGKKQEKLGNHRAIRQQFDADYAADPIVAIEPVGKLPCHCLTVDVDHTFLANDLVVHNSIFTCVMLFCWGWAKNPMSRWIFTSYAASLSQRDSLRCRDIITSKWYQERWGHRFKLKEDANAKSKFVNDKYGHRIATSTGGMGLGEGADVVVADDPNKQEDVWYKARRDEVIRNWTQTLSTRGNDPKKLRRIVTMQRLHEEDLSGDCLQSEIGYDHLCLPVEYEPHRYWLPGSSEPKPKHAITPTRLQRSNPALADPRKEPGELLFPQVFDTEQIAKLKIDLKAYGTASQFQQRPSPDRGMIFSKDFFRKYYIDQEDQQYVFVLNDRKVMIEECSFFQTIDTAMSVRERANFTVISTFAFTPCKNLLVYHVFRQRLEVPDQWPAIKNLRLGPCVFNNRKWITMGFWPKELMFQSIERKASGYGLLQLAKSENLPLRPLEPGSQDKVARSADACAMYENGRIWHRQGQLWLADWEDELGNFPASAHNDQCDTIAYAAILCTHDALLNRGYSNDMVWTKESDKQADKEESFTYRGMTIKFNEEREWWRN